VWCEKVRVTVERLVFVFLHCLFLMKVSAILTLAWLMDIYEGFVVDSTSSTVDLVLDGGRVVGINFCGKQSEPGNTAS
jgi:hypothetical protein